MKMNNLCRVCLSDEKVSLTSIDAFIEHRTGTLANLIQYCSGIEEPCVNDNLPQQCCEECISLLMSACKIKELCIDSDKTLRNYIKNEQILDSPPPDSTENTSNLEFYAENPIIKDEKVNKNYFLKCYICDKEFNLKKEKQQHLKVMHFDIELKCKLCRQKSQTTRGFDNHMMLHANPHLLHHMCQFCGRSYQKNCELKRHIKFSHYDKTNREYNFYCDHCDFKTFSKTNIKRHLTTIHLRIKAFACKLCSDKRYTSKITLEQHMIRKHNLETDFICLLCGKKFASMSFLRSHMKLACNPTNVRERGDPNEYRERLNEETEKYRCKVCGFIVEGKGKIAQHYAQRHKHSNTCQFCSASFNSYSNLKKHIQIIHNKIHKYNCSYCSRTFGQKNQLQSHINTHTGEKPFKCKFDFCSFRSGDLSAVSKHQKKCSSNTINM